MAKLTRYLQQIFGSNAGTNQIAEFGSLAAGTPVRASGSTITPTIVQALGNYLTGWKAAQVGAGNPAIEDMNALDWLFSRQLAYIMQTGVPEWDTSTTYYIGTLVNDGSGNIYKSLTDSNTGNALTSTTNWQLETFAHKTSNASPGTTPVGVGNFALTTVSSAVYNNTTGSYVVVPDLNIQLVTTGRPVQIGFQPLGGVSNAGTISLNNTGATGTLLADIEILNGATVIFHTVLAAYVLGSSTHIVPASILNCIDTSGAGTQHYTVQAKLATGTGGVGFNTVVAYAYEF